MENNENTNGARPRSDEVPQTPQTPPPVPSAAAAAPTPVRRARPRSDEVPQTPPPVRRARTRMEEPEPETEHDRVMHIAETLMLILDMLAQSREDAIADHDPTDYGDDPTNPVRHHTTPPPPPPAPPPPTSTRTPEHRIFTDQELEDQIE
jgi:hypothetical protein